MTQALTLITSENLSFNPVHSEQPVIYNTNPVMSILHTLFFTIPKSGHTLLFVLSLFGLISIFKYKQKDSSMLAMLFSFIFFLIWRLLWQISSPRYAVILIFPLSLFAAFLLSNMLQSKSAFYVYLLLAFIIIYSCHKIYIGHSNNTNLAFIAEFHDRTFSQKESNVLFTSEKEVFRLKILEKKRNTFEIYNDLFLPQDLKYFINSYNSINKCTFVDYVLDAKDNPRIFFDDPKSKHVLSLFSQNNKKKRHHIFQLKIAPPKLIPTLTQEDSEIANSFALFLANSKSISVKGEISDYPDYIEQKDFIFPVNPFSVRCVVRSQESEELLPLEDILLLGDSGSIAHSKDNIFKKGNMVECSIIPFESIPNKFQTLFHFSQPDSNPAKTYYILNLKPFFMKNQK